MESAKSESAAFRMQSERSTNWANSPWDRERGHRADHRCNLRITKQICSQIWDESCCLHENEKSTQTLNLKLLEFIGTLHTYCAVRKSLCLRLRSNFKFPFDRKRKQSDFLTVQKAFKVPVKVENAFRMQSERSTNWANSPPVNASGRRKYYILAA